FLKLINLYFFFQAEDGIRDKLVTGVQTCALPILHARDDVQVVHVEASTPEDLARFGALDVVACMQPRHSRPEINETWKANVGDQRWRYSWAMQTILRGGGRVALSSDWNTSEMDPMLGLYSATTRARLDGSDPWNP